MTALDLTIFTKIFSSYNILNFGIEILPISISLLYALVVTQDKVEFSRTFLFVYLITIVTGWAKNKWLFFVVAVLIGLYNISLKRD